jgi:hypothetical protein
MASDWNTWMERMLAADLTRDEMRLAIALARLTLGWNRTENELGERLLRELAGLHGRSNERARSGLVAKGLIQYTPGEAGRGHRSRYVLILAEMPAVARVFTGSEKPAVARAFPAERKARKIAPENPAVARARKGKGRGKNIPPAAPTEKTIQTKALEAYLAHGGSLELDGWRGALTRHAKTLVERGTDERTILAAAADLARQRAFPGYLTQRADEILATGGPCAWEGTKRAALTVPQLEECGCPRCAEYAEFKREGVRA